MALPPLSVGAFHDTAICPISLGAPSTAVGAPGTVRGVTGSDFSEYPPDFAAFTAATRNVYAVPFFKPVTVVAATAETESSNTEHVVPSHD
ncbi:unannotated protein [freshwater metagenome]|uniref:Unannotated protein n=1 Tax=freshwater metagenome TaxID=449393 RepID=A0A6J7UMU9_9ZZZZ